VIIRSKRKSSYFTEIRIRGQGMFSRTFYTYVSFNRIYVSAINFELPRTTSTFIIVFSYDRFAGFSSRSVLWFSATQLSFRRQFLRISNKETKTHRHLSSGILISNVAGEARFPTIFYNSPLDSTTIISSDLLHQSPFTIHHRFCYESFTTLCTKTSNSN